MFKFIYNLSQPHYFLEMFRNSQHSRLNVYYCITMYTLNFRIKQDLFDHVVEKWPVIKRKVFTSVES